MKTDVYSTVLRVCGCGICDEMFEIKKEFTEHCFQHEDTPQDDTSIDLCCHLSSCSCGKSTGFASTSDQQL